MRAQLLATVAIAAFATSSLIGQQQRTANAGPATYSSTTSFHVTEPNRLAFEAWIKDKYRKFAEGLMKEDPAIRGVTAYRVIYGGSPEPAANFYVTISTTGIPKPRAEAQNKVAQQLFSKSYADFQKEAQPLRRRVGQFLTRRVVGTPPTSVEGDVVRIDYKKAMPGRMGDYVQLERDYARLREAQVKAGDMKQWVLHSVVLPAGTERTFDAYTMHVGKDLEQSISWGRNSTALAAKLEPPLNITQLVTRSNDVAKTVLGETRVVVMAIRRP